MYEPESLLDLRTSIHRYKLGRNMSYQLFAKKTIPSETLMESINLAHNSAHTYHVGYFAKPFRSENRNS